MVQIDSGGGGDDTSAETDSGSSGTSNGGDDDFVYPDFDEFQQDDTQTSPEGTTATVESGSDDSGAGTSTGGGSTSSEDGGALDVEDIEETAPTGDETASTPEDGSQDTSDPGPTRDDLQPPPGPADTEPRDSRGETTATPTTGTPGDEGVAPPDARERMGDDTSSTQDTGLEVVELATPGGDTREVVRDPSTGRVVGDPTEVREQLAQQIEAQIEEQTGRDVTPGEEFEIVRRDGRLQTVLSGSFVASLSREAAREAGVDFGEMADWEQDIARMTGSGPAVESGGAAVGTGVLQELQREQWRRAQGPGIQGLNVEAVEQYGEQIADIEQQLEEQVGLSRAAALGITGAGPTQQLIESTELERGRDYVLDAIRTEQGVRLTAELTGPFRRQLATQAAEAQLERAYGLDLEPGEDFRIVETEGGFQPLLTQTGRDRISTRTLTETVSDVESFLGVDIPGGPIVEGVGAERELGRFGGGIGQQAEEAGREALRPLTEVDTVGALEGTLLDIQFGAVTDEGEVLPVSRGNVGSGGIHLGEPIDYALPLAAEFAGGTVAATKDLLDVSERFYEQTFTGDFEGATQTGLAATQAVTNQLLLSAEYALQEPEEFAKMAAVSLPLSYAIMGGAAAVGPRAGQLSRVIIQPGEEFLGYGGYAVTSRVAGETRAEQLFPGREPLLFSEESYLRAARALGGRATSVGTTVGSRVGRTGRLLGSGAAEATRRTPSMRLEFDTEAGLVDVDPFVVEQVREAAARPGRAVRAGVEAVRDAPGRVTAGTIEASERALEGGRETIRQGRQQLTMLELQAENLGYRLGQRTAAGVERAEQLPGDIAAIPGRGAAGLQEFAFGTRRFAGDARSAFGQRWELAGLRAEDLGFRAGAATAEQVNRLLSIDPADMALGGVRGPVRTGRQGWELAALRAEDIGFRLGQRTAAGVSRAEQLPGDVLEAGETALARAGEVPGDLLAAGDRALERGRQQLTVLEVQAEDWGFRAGQATAARVGEAEALLGDVAGFGRQLPSTTLAAAGRTRAAPREALAGFQFGRGAIGFSELPAFEAYAGQLQTGRAFELGADVGRRSTETVERTRALLEETRGEIESARSTLRSLPNLTLRVEPGLPRRPSLPDYVLEGEVDRGELPGLFGGGFDFETEPGEPAPDTRITGTGTDPVAMALEVEARQTTEGDVESVGRPRAVETTAPLGGSVGAGQLSPLLERAAARTELVQRAQVRPRQAQFEILGLDTETRGLLDLLIETRTETRTETDLRMDLELRSAIEAEARAEAEAEAEVESEFRSGAELEFFSDDSSESQPPWERGEPEFGGGVGGGETSFAAGWLREFSVALALGAGPREAASQEELAEAAAGAAGFTGELPLAVEVSGTEEEQAAIEEARELLFAGEEEDSGAWDLL